MYDLDYEPPDEREARIDAGDDLDPTLVCSFRVLDNPESVPCPQEATETRTFGESVQVSMPACPFHYQRGGILTADAQRSYLRAMIGKMNQDAVESARRLGLDADDISHAAFAHHCLRCGKSMFTGSSLPVCGECHEVLGDDVDRFVRGWQLDRFHYVARLCPECGTSMNTAHNWCGRCGKTMTP